MWATSGSNISLYVTGNWNTCVLLLLLLLFLNEGIKKKRTLNTVNRTVTSLKKGVVLNRVGREWVVSVGKDNIAHLLNQQSLKPVVDL